MNDINHEYTQSLDQVEAMRDDAEKMLRAIAQGQTFTVTKSAWWDEKNQCGCPITVMADFADRDMPEKHKRNEIAIENHMESNYGSWVLHKLLSQTPTPRDYNFAENWDEGFYPTLTDMMIDIHKKMTARAESMRLLETTE